MEVFIVFDFFVGWIDKFVMYINVMLINGVCNFFYKISSVLDLCRRND